MPLTDCDWKHSKDNRESRKSRRRLRPLLDFGKLGETWGRTWGVELGVTNLELGVKLGVRTWGQGQNLGSVCNFSFLDLTKELTVPRFVGFFEVPRVRSQRDFHWPGGRRILNLWPLRTTKHPVQDSMSSFRKSPVTRAARASRSASGKRTGSRPMCVPGANFRTSAKSLESALRP